MEGPRPYGALRRLILRRWKLLAAVLIAVSITLPAAYLASRPHWYDRDPFYCCVYSLMVNSTEEDIYTINVPIPCTNETEPASDFPGQVLVTGQATIGLVNTSHGYALRISGSGRVEVNWTSSSSGQGTGTGYYWNLTMREKVYEDSVASSKAWVACDCENVTAQLDYSTIHRRYLSSSFVSGTDREYRVSMVSGTGWMLVDCEVSGVIIN